MATLCCGGRLAVAPETSSRGAVAYPPRKLGLIVVDYVQLISANAPNERERITKISGQIRALAKDSGVPVLAVSQLSRPKDRNQNEHPNKFSMKESGSLENDANTILLIYRPMDEFGRPSGDDEIVIAKQRHGPVSNELVRFDSSTMTFFERAVQWRKPSHGPSGATSESM